MGRLNQIFIISMTVALLSCQTASETEPQTSVEKSPQHLTQIDQEGADRSVSHMSEDGSKSVVAETSKITTQVNSNNLDDEKICKEQVKTGTKFRKQVCKTRAQWDKDRANSKNWTEDLTRRSAYGS